MSLVQSWLSGSLVIVVVALVVAELDRLPSRADGDEFDRREDSW